MADGVLSRMRRGPRSRRSSHGDLGGYRWCRNVDFDRERGDDGDQEGKPEPGGGCRSLGWWLDLLFGAEEKTGARWSDLRHVSGHLPSGHLDAALPRIGDVSILSCSRNDDASATPASNAIDPTTMASVLAAGKRSHDHVFVDCSRCSDDFLTSVLAASHSAVLVVGDHVRAAAAAARRYAWLRGKISPLAVVQANSPRGIARDDIEHALGTELTAVIPHVPSMTSRADEGELPALPRAYANACDRILDVVMADARSPRRAA